MAARRKDARSVTIKKQKNGSLKFKVRCSKYLYTLVVKDSDKADKLQQSMPPGAFRCLIRLSRAFSVYACEGIVLTRPIFCLRVVELRFRRAPAEVDPVNAFSAFPLGGDVSCLLCVVRRNFSFKKRRLS